MRVTCARLASVRAPLSAANSYRPLDKVQSGLARAESPNGGRGVMLSP